jgi:hypothetical protein
MRRFILPGTRRKPEQRHGLLGEVERIRNHPTVPKRQRGDRVTVDEREQDRPVECASIIQLGQGADNMRLVLLSHAQDDGGRVRMRRSRGRAVSDPVSWPGDSTRMQSAVGRHRGDW